MNGTNGRATATPPAPVRGDDVSIRAAVIAEMKRRKWTVYEVWTNTLKVRRDVPRSVVYGFLMEPQERNISLPHAENLLASLGISLLANPVAPAEAAAEKNGKHK